MFVDGLHALSLAGSADEMYRSIGCFPEWLLSPREGTNYASPFNYAYQTDETFYAWLERPEHASRLKLMGRGMKTVRVAEGSGSVTDASGSSILG